MNPLFEVTIVDVLTLVASSFALYFSWNNRKSPLRENLYDRQIDSMNVLIRDIVEIEEVLMDWSVHTNLGNHDDAKIVHEKLEGLVDELEKKYAVAELVLPHSILLEFDKIMNYYSEHNRMILQKQIVEINVEELSIMVFNLSNEIREFIGLEKLTKANKKVI